MNAEMMATSASGLAWMVVYIALSSGSLTVISRQTFSRVPFLLLTCKIWSFQFVFF